MKTIKNLFLSAAFLLAASVTFGQINHINVTGNTTGINGDIYHLGGNVGIGLTNPGYLLDIKAQAVNEDLFRLSHPTAGSNAGFMIGFGKSSDLIDNTTIDFKVEYSSVDYTLFSLNRKNRNMYYIGEGKFGIGTADPTSNLTIFGNASQGWNSGIELNVDPPGRDYGRGYIIADDDGMKFKMTGTSNNYYFVNKDNFTMMFINRYGNVGIGTTSPNYKLDVEGTINATNILINGQALDNSNSTNSPWTTVEEFNAEGDGVTDDSQAIQDAINSKKLVSLSPGKTYLIENSVEIGQKEFLYIPPSSTLYFEASSSSNSAIIMKNHGTLAGKGVIKSSRYNSGTSEWNISSPKTAIKIENEGANVEVGKIYGFEIGIKMGGSDHIVGCNINISYFIDVLKCIFICPTASGFVNQNYFHWNATSLNMTDTHPLFTSTVGIYMDGAGEPNNNTFNGSIESYYIGLKLAGAFNRFLGFRAEKCDYTMVIHNAGNGCITRSNTIFGEYGNVGEFYNKILNQQTVSLQHAVQIYGPEGSNMLKTAYADHFYIHSDLSLKKNVSNVEGALNKILALRGVTYNLKSDIESNSKKENNSIENHNQYGFIAQELKEVLPDLVKTNPVDSLYAINYDGIISVLVEAFKEQQELVEEQEIDMAELKEQNYELFKILREKGIIEDNIEEMHTEIALLYQNNPNPFDSESEIYYYLPTEFKEAYILIMDMNGKMIKKKNIYAKGKNKITIQADELEAGMYIYSLISDDKVIGTKRMILTK